MASAIRIAGIAALLAAFGAAFLAEAAEISGEQILVHGVVRIRGGGTEAVARGLKGLRIFAGRRGGWVNAVYFFETGEYAAFFPKPVGKATWQFGVSVDPETGFLPGDFDAALELDSSMRTVRKDVILERGTGLLAGTVRAANGAAAANILVKIRELLRGNRVEPRELHAETDERGNYLAFVPAGRYVIHASSASGEGAVNPESQAVEFGADAEFREVSLAFRKTDAAIPVRVILTNGMPVAASVWAWSDRGGFVKGKANAEGRATLAAYNHADVWRLSATAEVDGVPYASGETVVSLGERVDEQLLLLARVNRPLPKERRIVADARKPLTIELEGMTLYLPAGAAAEDGLLTVRVKPTLDIPSRMFGVRALGPAYDIDVASAEGPVSRLRKEGRIEIAVPSPGQGRPAVAFWGEAAEAWVPVPSVAARDAAGLVAVAALDHLSSFVVTQPEPPPGGEGSGVTPTPSPTPTPFTFLMSVSAASSVVQGRPTTAQITVTATGGSPRSVNFSASGLPAGATGSFSPLSCVPSPTCTSTFTISTGASTPAGNHSITVSGISPPPSLEGTSAAGSAQFTFAVQSAQTPTPTPTSTAAPTATPVLTPTPTSMPQSTPVAGSPGGSGFVILDARVARVEPATAAEPARATVAWIARQPARASASCNMTDTTGRRIVVDVPFTVFETVVGTLEIDIPATIARGSNAACVFVARAANNDFQTWNVTFTVPGEGASPPAATPSPAAIGVPGAPAGGVSSPAVSPSPTPRVTPAAGASPAPVRTSPRPSPSPAPALERAERLSATLVPSGVVLRRGATGIMVNRLQQALDFVMPEDKIPAEESGTFGPSTFQTVVKFQERYMEQELAALGLKGGTGIAATRTLNKLRLLLTELGSPKSPSALVISPESREVLRQIPFFQEGDRFGFGSFGGRVGLWQRLLKALGVADIRVETRFFGIKTREGTRELQISLNITPVNGVADPQTIRAVNDILRRVQ